MNHLTNLLPLNAQISFECRRQVQVWGTVWIVLVLTWIVIYGLLDRKRIQLKNSIANAEAAVAPIRDAELGLEQMRNEKELLIRHALVADALQQTDTPLALLQSIGSSSQRLGKDIQIDSLRMDELSGSSGDLGKSPMKRKQILLVGSADADFLITAFVSRLSECDVFRIVELESSHAIADKLSAKRSFQIRCQQ